MAIRILSSENISGEVLIASGKYLSWGTAGSASIEGSTVSNKLQFRTNSTNAVIIDSSQNVGIGNFTNPTDGNLVVKKDGLNTGIPNSLTSASFSESGGQLKGLTIGYRTDETTAVIAARTATGDIAFMGYNGGWLETARFTNDNRLGIGTDSPASVLHIKDNSASPTQLSIQSNDFTRAEEINFLNPSTSAISGQIKYYTNPTVEYMSFSTSNNSATVERMRITGSGNVGIGTGSPGRKLTVTGDVSGDANNLLLSNENDTNGDSASIGFSMLSNNTYVKAGIFFQRITTQGRGDLIFANNNEVNGNNVGITNEIMSIRNTGAIEIKGTSTTLNGKAFITNTDALMTIGSTQSSGVPKDMAFFNGGERMRIQATTGNVGIGVTSPAGKLEVAGGNTLGFRLSNLGNQSAYDQVRMTYSGYNSGSPTVTFMPLTTPGSGNAYTTFLFQNTNGINASSNNNANVAIDGTLQVGRSKGLGETTLIMNNYDTSLAGTNQIQNSIRMSGRYWSGSASQLVETRINSVHQESNGNGGSALTFMTQTGGSAVVEQMRIDKAGNVGIGRTSASKRLDINLANAGQEGASMILRNTAGGSGAYNRIYFAPTASDPNTRSAIIQGENVDGNNNMALVFKTSAGNNPEEALRINQNGKSLFKQNVDILTPATLNSNILKVRSQNSSSFTSSVLLVDCDRTTTNNTYNLAAFTNAGTTKCVITDGGDLKNTNNSYGAISDERLKENIKDATPKLEDLMKVKIRNYNFIGQEDKQIGVVAQELEKVFPSMIDNAKTPDSEDETLYKSVKYSVFVPMLIKSIQELKAEIELLKNK